MTTRRWEQEVWSVLMDDGTEILDVVINQADRNAAIPVMKQHKWDGDDYRIYSIQYWIWSAARRRGDITDPSFQHFLDHVADFDKEKSETADPTPPDTSAGSP